MFAIIWRISVTFLYDYKEKAILKVISKTISCDVLDSRKALQGQLFPFIYYILVNSNTEEKLQHDLIVDCRPGLDGRMMTPELIPGTTVYNPKTVTNVVLYSYCE